MPVFKLYYKIKRIIPRWLQIAIRRFIARVKYFLFRASWPIDSFSARKPAVFKGWPGGKRFALVLRHDVETGAGLRNCLQLISMEKAFGLKSAFYMVPEDYIAEERLRRSITNSGCEVGVHGLKHDGRLYSSRRAFISQAGKINQYLREWKSVGFASPSAHHVFEWIHDLDILYDSSSFDTDPFEPQPDGVRSIFPILLRDRTGNRPFVEMPYTLPQDFTLFVILQKRSIRIWKKKLDWIASIGGMAMIVTHPDYMRMPEETGKKYGYPACYYQEFLSYIENKYHGLYWHALPREVAEFWRSIAGTQDP